MPGRNNSGNASTYVLLILPFAVALSSLIVDISGWNSTRAQLQQHADRIALAAAPFLPDETAVSAIAANEAVLAGIPDIQVSTEFADDTSILQGSVVKVTLSSSYRPAFASVFEDKHSTFRAARSATAAIIPTDTVLILANGHTLRPGFAPDGSPADPWGTEDSWPASEAFDCYTAGSPSDPELQINWNAFWSSVAVRRWATQACFNPQFSPLKTAAITLAEAAALSPTSRLALIVTPGEKDQPGYSVMRHLSAGVDGGFFTSGTAQSTFLSYRERRSGLRGESCVIFSEPPISAATSYALPGEIQGEAMDLPVCGSPFPFSAELKPLYTEHSLTLKQAIYWLPAELPADGFSAEPDLAAALEAAYQEIIDVEGSRKLERDVRKNLSSLARRQIIAFVDALPDARVIQPVLTRLDQAQVNIRIVPYEHAALSNENIARLRARARNLAQLTEISRLKILPAASPEELEQKIAPMLTASVKEAVLRK